MYYRWLDRWDETRARRGDEGKKRAAVIVDAKRAFPGAENDATLEEFCAFAELATLDPAFFDEPSRSDLDFQKRDGWLRFPSDMSTEIEANNLVWARITESGSFDKALVIFHHWNADGRDALLANLFSRLGITVVEIAMPYHFERSRPGSLHADFMLSPNLGMTIQSVRQAVWDGRKLIRWLKSANYREVSVLGMSLGSWVAAIIAAHDRDVAKASLFLTAGSLADMVWTGRATRMIRSSLEPEIELRDLRRAWKPLNLECYARRLARPDLALHIVLGNRDNVILPELSEAFLGRLKEAGAEPKLLRLNCGHYSLAVPPYSVLAGLSLMRFLM